MYVSIGRMFNALTALAVTLASAGAWADDENQGRISYATDDALVLGEGDEDWSFAGINTIVLEGDRIWADDSGAIELELPGGFYVRLADGSEMEVLDMPPDGLVRGWVGSFYVQRLNESNGDFTFDTGAAQFDFEKDTVARFDVLTDGSTTLSVNEGRVGVYTDSGRVMDVSRGDRTYIDPGLLPSPPERFAADDDTFGVWNQTRVNYFADYVKPEQFRSTSSVPIGARDLNDYGEWVYVNNTPYWRPIYVSNYVPYRYGRWSYVGNQGQVWVGYYPFDYFTGHYGYWDYDHRYGWLWGYDPIYAPARVTSIYYGNLLFWAPCNRYGYPVYGTHFDLTIGSFHFSLGFSSYCYQNAVYYPNYYNQYYYVQPLHRRVIADQPRDAQAYVWNHTNRTDLAHVAGARQNSGLREWNGEPTGGTRGFAENERQGSARTLAANLQDRHGREDFQTASLRTASADARTSSAEAGRQARTREIGTISDRGVRTPEQTPDGVTDRTARSASTERTTSADRDVERSDLRMTTVPTRSDDVRGSSATPDRAAPIGDTRGNDRTTRGTDGGNTGTDATTRNTDRGSANVDRESGRDMDTRDSGSGRDTTSEPKADWTAPREDVRSLPPAPSVDRSGSTGGDSRSGSKPRSSSARSTAAAPERPQPAYREPAQTYREPEPVRAPERGSSERVQTEQPMRSPAPQERAPAPEYRAPAPEYHAPAPSHQVPAPAESSSQMIRTAPVDGGRGAAQGRTVDSAPRR